MGGWAGGDGWMGRWGKGVVGVGAGEAGEVICLFGLRCNTYFKLLSTNTS